MIFDVRDYPPSSAGTSQYVEEAMRRKLKREYGPSKEEQKKPQERLENIRFITTKEYVEEEKAKGDMQPEMEECLLGPS